MYNKYKFIINCTHCLNTFNTWIETWGREGKMVKEKEILCNMECFILHFYKLTFNHVIVLASSICQYNNPVLWSWHFMKLEVIKRMTVEIIVWQEQG